MIIINGYISTCSTVGGGIDSIGCPVATTESWSALIPCQWKTLSVNNTAKDAAGNAVRSIVYEILIDMRSLLMSEKMRLYDKTRTMIAERPAISIEGQPQVGLTKITL